MSRGSICTFSRNGYACFVALTQLLATQFSAPDLSSIAHSLDELEGSFDDNNHSSTSTNMDDTGTYDLASCLSPSLICCGLPGFFSVQVLEKALQVWGLTYVATPLNPGFDNLRLSFSAPSDGEVKLCGHTMTTHSKYLLSYRILTISQHSDTAQDPTSLHS